ncbi:L,D-transpeptidase family protein [Deminuibacter soli]|uniref:L,D-TPase catalytic domain-containing protein n=1 Tax=Deminuibacter soli TaxID=2291815 RepID=A0A3E1NFW8_9BACT|nr:L,D-transpeptidase family protein [Deminuibacter soli]RFM26711.1 hypothetical protein DXN05_19275 [Deminuibacter soli]
MRKSVYLLTGILLLAVSWGCRSRHSKNKNVTRDTSITEETSYNDIFLDSAQLHHFVSTDTAFKQFEEQYIAFYKQRNYEYAWFDSSGLGEQANNFANLLGNAAAELQDSSIINPRFTQLYEHCKNDLSHKTSKADKLKAELYFTGQFFMYAAKVYKGSDIDATELGWFIPRKKLDLSALLDSVIRTKKDASQYVTLNDQYKKLEESLMQYSALEKAHDWSDTVAKAAKPYKKGMDLPVIATIKQRLYWLGDMTEEDTTNLFDSTLFTAARSFQRRMGLEPDGVIGSKMIDELNVAPARRIQQILINLERVRWMPPIEDSEYILVNIPEYRLHAYDSGAHAFDMNVIVGNQANSTVIFNGKLKYVVFAPYWNVPVSIVKKEVLPGIENDKNYLASHNMEITSGKNAAIPEVRQKPGPWNSLGLVKFLFPNNYDIYLHDTPNHDLFDQSNRSLSHGCIRLSEPKKMAEFLLRGQPEWTSEKIDSFMHGDKEYWVTLNKQVPVYIGYFTAWVDRDGLLNFRKDIYGHDAKMADKLFVKQ